MLETIIIHACTCFLVVASNVILIAIAFRNLKLRLQKDTFVIFHLAFWDTVHLTVVLLSSIMRIYLLITNDLQLRESTFCLLFPWNNLYTLNLHMVPYASVMVSIDRFMATWCPLLYRRMTVTVPMKMSLVAFFPAMIITIVAAFINFTAPPKPVSPLCFTANFLVSYVWNYMLSLRMALMLLSIVIYIPVFVKIIMLYSAMRRTTSVQQKMYMRRLIRTTVIFSIILWGSIFLAIIPDALLIFTEFGQRNQSILYIINGTKSLLNVLVISLLHVLLASLMLHVDVKDAMMCTSKTSTVPNTIHISVK